MLPNFEHNEFAYMQNFWKCSMHVSCHELLQIAEMLPIFQHNGLAYVIIENAVVRNAHN